MFTKQCLRWTAATISAVWNSPYWSALSVACSRSCRGRGICWFAKRPACLELPAPGRWKPAWRGAALHWEGPPWLRPLRHPRPAPLLLLGTTRVGRTPRGHNKRSVFMNNSGKNTLTGWFQETSQYSYNDSCLEKKLRFCVVHGCSNRSDQGKVKGYYKVRSS